MPAHLKQPLNPEHDRQSRRHHQQVIKMGMQKRPKPLAMRVEKPAKMRTDQQTIERVSRKRNNKQSVMQITEMFHNASKTNPAEIASNALKSKIIFLFYRIAGIPSAPNFRAMSQFNVAGTGAIGSQIFSILPDIKMVILR